MVVQANTHGMKCVILDLCIIIVSAERARVRGVWLILAEIDVLILALDRPSLPPLIFKASAKHIAGRGGVFRKAVAVILVGDSIMNAAKGEAARKVEKGTTVYGISDTATQRAKPIQI